MSAIPTPEELLTIQCERVLSLYDRGLLGMEELDAIRAELLDDTAHEAVTSLLNNSGDGRVIALLKGEPIPLEVDEQGVGWGDLNPEDSFAAEGGDEEATSEPESSMSEGPVSAIPLLFLGVILMGLVWQFVLQKDPHVTPVSEVAPSSSSVSAPDELSGMQEQERPATVLSMNSLDWKNHPLEQVWKDSRQRVGLDQNKDWTGLPETRLEEDRVKSLQWLPLRDLSPWAREARSAWNINGRDYGFTMKFLRKPFPEIGTPGSFSMQWELPFSWGKPEELERSFRMLFKDGEPSEWPVGSAGCVNSLGDRLLCWWVEAGENGVVFRLEGEGVRSALEQLKLSLARPLGTYTEARNALVGTQRDLKYSLDRGRTALAEFGAVHPRLFHGHTVVNLCHAQLMAGERRTARRKCQLALDHSLEGEVRGEARFLLARLSLWENARDEAIALLNRSMDEVQGRRLRNRIRVYLGALTNRETWEKGKDFRQVVDWVGCAAGRSLGVSWRWLPMEFGFRDAEHLQQRGAEIGHSDLARVHQNAVERCHAGTALSLH